FSKESQNRVALEPLKVVLVQTKRPTKIDYTPEELLSDFRNQLKLLGSATKEGSIIVFPETSNFSKTLSGFLDFSSAQAYFNNLSSEPLMILDNIRSPEKDGLVSKTIFINSKNGVAQFSDKRLLTPGGEYLPFIMKWPLWLLNRSIVNSFKYSQEFSKGTHTENLYFQDRTAKVVICSEILSPGLFRDADYQFIIGQSSFGMFKGDRQLEYQIMQALRFRAAENRKPAVLASNFGRSYIIDNNGNIIKSTDSNDYQILTADIVPNKGQTWYNKLGDLPILLLSLAVFGLSVKPRKK
ncbi:MAG: nitrilase-related carbon-nitrogen hydrolase, partial [Patescibacteria group bacterium]